MPRTVEEIIKELEHLAVRQSIALKELSRVNAANEACDKQDDEWEFPIGGRVRILNPKKEFAHFGRNVLKGNEFGTVVKVTKFRVHVELDSGKTIQRSPENVAVVLTE